MIYRRVVSLLEESVLDETLFFHVLLIGWRSYARESSTCARLLDMPHV